MSETFQQQVHDLRQEVRELRQEIADLKAELRPRPMRTAPPPPSEEGVQIHSPPPPALVIPTESEIDSLLNVVRGRYGRFVAADHEFRAGFKTAVTWLLNGVNRAEKPGKFYLEHWVYRAEDWCRAICCAGLPLPANDIGRALFAASIAVGDILFILPDQNAGTIANLALADYGTGKRPTERWREIVAGTAGLLPPMQPEALRGTQPSNIRIDIQGGVLNPW